MAMHLHVMKMMVQRAPARTTQRPLPASVALQMIGKTATGNKYAHPEDRISLYKIISMFFVFVFFFTRKL